MTLVGGRLSPAARRFLHWDGISRNRALSDIESRELEHNMRLMQREEIRAQATPPPARKRGKK